MAKLHTPVREYLQFFQINISTDEEINLCACSRSSPFSCVFHGEPADAYEQYMQGRAWGRHETRDGFYQFLAGWNAAMKSERT